MLMGSWLKQAVSHELLAVSLVHGLFMGNGAFIQYSSSHWEKSPFMRRGHRFALPFFALLLVGTYKVFKTL
jgi:hypothetical protein